MNGLKMKQNGNTPDLDFDISRQAKQKLAAWAAVLTLLGGGGGATVTWALNEFVIGKTTIARMEALDVEHHEDIDLLTERIDEVQRAAEREWDSIDQRLTRIQNSLDRINESLGYLKAKTEGK